MSPGDEWKIFEKIPDVAIQSRWPAQLKIQSDEQRPTRVCVKNQEGGAQAALRRGDEGKRHQALQLNQPAWPLGISRASALAGIYESPGNLENPATVLRPETKKPLRTKSVAATRFIRIYYTPCKLLD